MYVLNVFVFVVDENGTPNLGERGGEMMSQVWRNKLEALSSDQTHHLLNSASISYLIQNWKVAT